MSIQKSNNALADIGSEGVKELWPSYDEDMFLPILALRSMFWRPAYHDSGTAWIEHIPFAFWISEAHRPRVFVELGTHKGGSYFAFCQAVERLGLDTRCFAVDTWIGDEHAGYYEESVFEKVKAHNEAQYSGFSRLVRSTFDAALNHFADDSIDLLHIDGLHTFEAVKHDFETWLPKLSENAVVIMHDTNVRERNFGVFKFFEGLKVQYQTFEFAHGHGLGVLGVGQHQSEIMQRLFQASAKMNTRRAIQEVFSRLGVACADARAAIEGEAHIKSLSDQINHGKRQLDNFRQSLENTSSDLNNRTKELNATKAQLHIQEEQRAVERGHLAERIILLQELRAELKEDIIQLHDQIEANSSELAEKSHQLATLTQQTTDQQQQISEANKYIKIRDQKVAELTDKLHDSQSEAQETKVKLAQLEQQKAILNNEKQTQAEALAELESCLQAKEHELASQQQQVHELEREINEKSELFEAMEVRFAEERVRARKVHEDTSTTLAELEKENKSLKSNQQVQAKNLEGRLQELTTLTQKLEEGEADLHAKEQELAAQQQRVEDLEKELNEKSKILGETEKQFAEEIGLAYKASEETSAMLAELESENKKLKSERMSQNEALAELEASLQAKAQAETVQQQLTEMLERELKEKSEDYHVMEVQLTKERVRACKLQEMMRLDIVEIQEEYKELKSEQQQQVKVLEEREASLRAKEQEVAKQQRRAEGLEDKLKGKSEAIEAMRVQLAKDKERANKVQETMRKDLAKIKAETEKLKSEQKVQKKKLEARFRELATLTQMLEEHETNLHVKENKLFTQQQRAKGLENELKEKSVALEAMRVQLSKQKEKSNKVQETMRKDLAKIEAENEKLKSEQQAQAKAFEECEASFRLKAQEAADQQQRAIGLENELKGKSKALDAMQERYSEDGSKANEAQETLKGDLAQLRNENMDLQSEHRIQKKRLEDRFKELATLTKLLEKREADLRVKKQEVVTEQQRANNLEKELRDKIKKRLWKNPFKRAKNRNKKIKRQVQLIQQSGLFDKAWYLSQYPDVAKRANPIEHYLSQGVSSGKNPRHDFDTNFYLKTYPDVAKAGVNPLIHYIQFGREEGRAINRVKPGA